MQDVPFVLDVLSQAESLQAALRRIDLSPLEPLADAFRQGYFDRVILTGMGASLNGAYPAWLHLVRSGLPALWVDASELVHYARQLITERTLLWVVSQSGQSAEIVSLLALARSARPAALLATTNQPGSPLALAVKDSGQLSVILPLDAESELTVSTRTYLHTLAITQLAAKRLCGEDPSSYMEELLATASGIADYLAHWEEHLRAIADALGRPRHLALLGRGSSLASARTGALIIHEAAKYPALSFQTGEFRHGPLELAGPDLTALLFAGAPETVDINRRLLSDLKDIHVNAFWLGTGLRDQNSLPMPHASGIGLPLAEILPAQLVSIHLAQQNGVEPGRFYFSGKVTKTE